MNYKIEVKYKKAVTFLTGYNGIFNVTNLNNNIFFWKMNYRW